MAEKSEKRTNLRWTDEEYAALSTLAEEAGITVPVYIRQALQQQTQQPEPEPQKEPEENTLTLSWLSSFPEPEPQSEKSDKTEWIYNQEFITSESQKISQKQQENIEPEPLPANKSKKNGLVFNKYTKVLFMYFDLKKPAVKVREEREKGRAGDGVFFGLLFALPVAAAVWAGGWEIAGPWPLWARSPDDTSIILPSVGASILSFLHFAFGVNSFKSLTYETLIQYNYTQYINAIVFITSCVFFIVFFAGFTYGSKGRLKERHIKGKTLLNTAKDINKEFRREILVHKKGINIHPLVSISRDRETRHIFITGAIGSGKTQVLRNILNSILERMQNSKEDRLLIYDNKSDFTKGLPVEDSEMILLAPWDKRAWAWDVAKDVLNSADAATLASKLIPDSGGGDAFWNNASRQILESAILHLQEEKLGSWDWYDLYKASSDLQTILTATKLYAPGLFQILATEGENKTRDNLTVNTQAFLAPIRYFAEAWSNRNPATGEEIEPGKKALKISIREWAVKGKGRRVLILGGNKRYEVLEKAYVQSIISAFSSIMNSPEMTDSKTRRIWLILDEFPQLGKLESFAPFLEVGRSKGICVVLGLQDISQIKEVYSNNTASVISGICGTYIICRSEGESKRWLSTLSGQRILEVKQQTSSKTVSGNTTSTTYIEKVKPVIDEEDISTLGSRKDGILAILNPLETNPCRLIWPYVSYPDIREGQIPAKWTVKYNETFDKQQMKNSA